MNNTLKAGSKAYWLTHNSGHIPCVVEHVRDTKEHTSGMTFDLSRHGVSSRYIAFIRLTADRGPYRKGERMEVFAHDVAPRNCVRRSGAVWAFMVEVG